MKAWKQLFALLLCLVLCLGTLPGTARAEEVEAATISQDYRHEVFEDSDDSSESKCCDHQHEADDHENIAFPEKTEQPLVPLGASASEITQQLSNLKNTYKSNSYWNHKSGQPYDGYSVTNTPCGTNGYVCNELYGGKQCYAFARHLAKILFGSYPPNASAYNDGTTKNGWRLIRNKSNVTLEPGDYIRADNHSAIVWYVDGDNIYVAQCWGSDKSGCKLNWGAFWGSKKCVTLNDILNTGFVGVWKHPDSNTGPADITTITGVDVVGSTVTVNWTAAANATSYDVYLIQSPWGWDAVKYCSLGLTNTLSATFYNVADGYYAAFVITRPNDDQTQSNWVSFLVDTTNYTLDVNGWLDGIEWGDLSDYGTFDLSVSYNGTITLYGPIRDFCQSLPSGANYCIYNITALDGHVYNGVHSGALSGTISSDVSVSLDFRTMLLFDVNGWINGGQTGDIAGYGTFDLFINGALDGSSLTDKCAQWPYGSTYEIKNIRPLNGYSFDGILTGAEADALPRPGKGRTGTITENISVNLMFHACPSSVDESPTPQVYQGHTYYFFSSPVTWYDAKAICENMGGHLATITSADENAFVYSLANGSMAWLGATDINQEGKWEWVNGEPFSFSCWAENQPDNYQWNDEGQENFLHFYWNGIGTWNDTAGFGEYPFICEMDTAQYTITYDANGGTGTPGPQTKTHGQPLTLSSTKPTRTGYTFLGWAESATATSAQYQPGGQFTRDANATIYAVWQQIETPSTETLTFAVKNGNASLTVRSVLAMDKIQVIVAVFDAAGRCLGIVPATLSATGTAGEYRATARVDFAGAAHYRAFVVTKDGWKPLTEPAGV